MSATKPVSVLIMDNDYYALQWIGGLIMRDPRTTACGLCENLDDFYKIAQFRRPDSALLDVDTGLDGMDLAQLMNVFFERSPGCKLICISNGASVAMIETSYNAGAQGFLFKSEIRLGLVTAILLALQGRFVVTRGIQELLGSHGNSYIRKTLQVLTTWQPNPNLTPQLQAALMLRLLHGMHSASAAKQLYLQPGTIEKYVSTGYDILASCELSDHDFEIGVNLDLLSPEERALVLFTAIPAKSSYD